MELGAIAAYVQLRTMDGHNAVYGRSTNGDHLDWLWPDRYDEQRSAYVTGV